MPGNRPPAVLEQISVVHATCVSTQCAFSYPERVAERFERCSSKRFPTKFAILFAKN